MWTTRIRQKTKKDLCKLNLPHVFVISADSCELQTATAKMHTN